jgi:hypothetical protein
MIPIQLLKDADEKSLFVDALAIVVALRLLSTAVPLSKTFSAIVGDDPVDENWPAISHRNLLPMANLLAGIVSEPVEFVGDPNTLVAEAVLATALQDPQEKMHPPSSAFPEARAIAKLPWESGVIAWTSAGVRTRKVGAAFEPLDGPISKVFFA